MLLDWRLHDPLSGAGWGPDAWRTHAHASNFERVVLRLLRVFLSIASQVGATDLIATYLKRLATIPAHCKSEFVR
jgi:hypothetical protein